MGGRWYRLFCESIRDDNLRLNALWIVLQIRLLNESSHILYDVAYFLTIAISKVSPNHL